MISWAYLLASVLFILGLQGLGDARRARRGMQLAALRMLVAVGGTMLHLTSYLCSSPATPG